MLLKERFPEFKVRYSKQLLKYDCGSCVLINAVKWCGFKTSYRKEYRALCDILGIDSDGGTFPDAMRELIEFSNFPFKISRISNSPTLAMIKKHLAKDGSVMLFYNNHVSLVVRIRYNRLTLINHGCNATISNVSFKRLEKLYGVDKAFFIVKNYE